MPDDEPQMRFEIVQPFDERLLIDLFLRRIVLHAEAMYILEAGEELFRIAYLVDAEFKFRNVVSDELDFDALAGRECARS